MQSTAYNTKSTAYNVKSTTYNVKSTAYNGKYTTYNTKSTTYNVKCTAYNGRISQKTVLAFHRNRTWATLVGGECSQHCAILGPRSPVFVKHHIAGWDRVETLKEKQENVNKRRKARVIINQQDWKLVERQMFCNL